MIGDRRFLTDATWMREQLFITYSLLYYWLLRNAVQMFIEFVNKHVRRHRFLPLRFRAVAKKVHFNFYSPFAKSLSRINFESAKLWKNSRKVRNAFIAISFFMTCQLIKFNLSGNTLHDFPLKSDLIKTSYAGWSSSIATEYIHAYELLTHCLHQQAAASTTHVVNTVLSPTDYANLRHNVLWSFADE